MKVLVIGGTRLIGKELIKRLLYRNADVTIVTRGRANDEFGNNVCRVKLDVMDSESVSQNLPQKAFDIVYDMLVLSPDHIKERLLLLNCDRYIMVSSAEVYKKHHIGICEEEYNAEREPWTYCGYEDVSYEIRKRYAESALVVDFKEIPSVRVRFPVVISAEDYTKRVMWYVDHIINHIPMYIDNMKEKFAFISAEDSGAFLDRLCDTDISTLHLFEEHTAINAAGKGIISPAEICQWIERISGERAIYSSPMAFTSYINEAPFNGSGTYSLNTSLAEQTGFSFMRNRDYFISVLEKLIY